MSVDKNKVDGIFLIILSKEYVGFVGLDFRMAIIEAYSTTRKCGLASQSTNTHGHFLEVKKNKADDVDELWECVRDLSESSFDDAE